MTLSSPTLSNTYTGNGHASSYAYTFFIFDEKHLQISVVSAGLTYGLVLDVDYTVTAIQEENGSTINFINNGQTWLTQIAPEGNLVTGAILTISRVVPLVQDTSIRDQGAGYQESIEDALDYLTMIAQQIVAGLNSESGGNDIIVSPGNGLVLTDTQTGIQYRVVVTGGILGIETV